MENNNKGYSVALFYTGFLLTLVTDELKKSLEKGYTIEKIYEVWHFDETEQYDPASKTGGLFTEYVNTFLKRKQESGGWPEWCQTEEDKWKYIRDYHEKEGILLDYNNIKKNPGMRALAKLMLNSFWGEFGQRSNMAQIQYFSEMSDYLDFLSSDKISVTGVNFVSDTMVGIRYQYKEEFVEESERTNVVIAADTIAHARLKLYNYLENLNTNAIYADTDSVVFTSGPGKWKPELGDYLGELTNEVAGNQISEFVTGGPKNYAYRVVQPEKDGTEIVCIVKEITLNYKSVLTINFNTIKDMVINNRNDVKTVSDNFKIMRDNMKLLSLHQDKDYKIVFDKRVVMGDYSTRPYGF